MPVEFALRPRIRLSDDFAAPRRPRFRLPRFTFHVVGYWLAIGGATYAFIHTAEVTRERVRSEAAEPPGEAPPTPKRDWWKPIPAPPLVASRPPVAEPELAQASVPEQSLALPEPPPEPEQPRIAAVRGSEPRVERAETPALPSGEREPTAASGSIPSCESAIASASQDIDFAHADRTADLPSSALAAVLENGAWLGSCNIPERTALEVCVAIRGGRVVGASVFTRPANAALAACVRKRASGLHFPYSSHLDVARTRF